MFEPLHSLRRLELPSPMNAVTAIIFSITVGWPNSSVTATAQPNEQVAFRAGDGELLVTIGGRPFASYVFRDADIPRPYFAHVKATSGDQVTRRHPPVEGRDRVDHSTMHPGIWMAFGDLDGADSWRNRAKVEHQTFVEPPRGGAGSGSFVELKHHLRADGTPICTELFRCSIYARTSGYFLTWDSTFSAEREFFFGDQEEMGLGIRVATFMSELEGGRLSDSSGRTGAEAIWSQPAAWCDYSGTVEDRRVGMTVMCHPDNFRESWMHARNYGFIAANAFGRRAMNKGPESRVVVKPGESLRLRYAVWIHSHPSEETTDGAAAYQEYLQLAGS